MRVARFLLQMALGILLPLAVQVWDRRRLSAELADRCWNPASWGAALYAFGPLSMLGWGWVTRRWVGLGLGLVSALGQMAVIAGLDRLVLAAFGQDPETLDLLP